MRMNRCEFYIRKDFAFYDSGVAPVVGPQIVFLYEVLRRFIWRAAPKSPLVAKLVKEGFVVAVVTQKSLAGAIGTGRRQTVGEYLAELKKIGWVQVQTDLKSVETCYVLGERVADSRGRKHEVLFADAWCQDAWDFLEAASKTEFGSILGVDDDGEEVEQLSRSVTSTPWEWRIDKIREFVGATAILDSDHVVPEGPTPCTPESAPPALSSVHPLHATACTVSREQEVENSEVEKREPASLRSSVSLGFRGSSVSHEGRGEKSGEESRLGWGQRSLKEETPRRPGPLSHLDKPSKFLRAPEPDRERLSVPRRLPEFATAPVPIQKSVEEVPEEDAEPDGGWTVPTAPIEPEPVDRVSTLERIAAEAKKRGMEARSAAQLIDRRLAQKKQNLAGSPVPLSQKKVFADIEEMWLAKMRERFPGVTIAAWGGKERGQVKQLLEKYGGVVAKTALDYVVSRWDDIRARFLKGKGGVPSIGFLLRFHDTLVVEAQRRSEWLQVKEEWESWQIQHPSDPYPPEDLEARFQRCKRDVDGLGLPT